jgi:hypothetical protein
MFYINSVVREKYRYYSPFFGDETPIFGKGHENDFDDRYMAQIIIDYLEKRLCVSEKLVRSFYEVLIKDLFGRDEVLELRKQIDKSSGKQYYNRKGYTKAFLFDVFNPQKEGTPKDSGVIFRTVIKGKPVYILNKEMNYFPLFSEIPNKKEEYLDEIKKVETYVFGKEMKNDQKTFTLFNDDLLIIVINLVEEVEINDRMEIINEKEIEKSGDMIKQHLKTLDIYKTKLY